MISLIGLKKIAESVDDSMLDRFFELFMCYGVDEDDITDPINFVTQVQIRQQLTKQGRETFK